MLSISTCWNSHRHTDGAAMLEELLEFGFDAVELGHGIRISLMPGILKMVEAGRVRFSSVHNFCPLPIEVTHASPDCLQFSSPRLQERSRAIRQTRQTIDYAVRLGAPFVVLHLGRVTMAPVTAQLIDLAAEGRHLAPEYAARKWKAVQEREEKAPPYLERMRECLREIADYAGEKGVRLGVEGRQAYEEIPTEREALALLDEFDPAVVGYWHDFGHIQIKANLGFLDHDRWLSSVAPRLLGAHLHDVLWPGRDHMAPFTGGCVDYERLIPLMPKGIPYIWEMSPRRTKEEIATSLQLWRERFSAPSLS